MYTKNNHVVVRDSPGINNYATGYAQIHALVRHEKIFSSLIRDGHMPTQQDSQQVTSIERDPLTPAEDLDTCLVEQRNGS